MVDDHVAADRQEGSLAEVAEQLRSWSVDRADLGGVVVSGAVVADDRAVADDVPPLAVVRDDGADAVEALGEIAEHAGDAVPHTVIAALRRRSEPKRADREDRHDERERDQRQLRRSS